MGLWDNLYTVWNEKWIQKEFVFFFYNLNWTCIILCYIIYCIRENSLGFDIQLFSC